MFGINVYAITAVAAIALFSGGFINGCTYQKSKQEKVIRDKERQYQVETDQIRKEKDAQIKAINSQLVDAISELRKRPSRTETTNNGQSCNGASLYAEDAEFLVREAARADEIRIGLQACYKQYDAITK
jgi:hypothetical protein